MTRLFLITVRWMKKDRKRTLLSFISVLLAVYMMAVLGIYFSSAVSMLRSKERYENGGYHVRFHCENEQQAKQVSQNAAVSQSGRLYEAQYGFVQDYLDKYKDKVKGASEFYLPTFTLNGKNAVSPNFYSYVSGDALSLSGTDRLLRGRLPEKAGEITMSSWVLQNRDLDIGDTVVFRYEVRKGTVTYSEYKEKMVPKKDDPNDMTNEKVYTFKDRSEDAWLIINNFVTQINSVYSRNLHSIDKYTEALSNIRYLFTLSDRVEKDDLWKWGYQLGENDYKNLENNEFMEAQAKTYGEPVEAIEYKATIVGISEFSFAGYLYEDDEQAKKLFPVVSCDCYTRISDGLDIDDEAEQIKKTVGLPDEYKDESGAANPTAELHDMLLFYEGRSLYDPNSSDPIIILGVFAVILAVFIFFARLIINNAFELSSAYRLSQYSSLKTVGVSNAQMFVMVMGECLLYLTAALPIALLLAFATGKLIISNITELKIFDALYGSGVTDKFFKLEISAPIMILIVTITVFSVLLSAYAAAIRMKKMPAVQARAADGTKPPKAVKRKWLSKRLFGFSAGYAIRSAFRKKMRFFITLLAAVVSATMVITIAALMFAVEKSGKKMYDADAIDFSVEIQSDFTGGSNISDDYKKLYDSGLFRIINTNTRFIDCFDKQGSWDKSFISDKLNKEYLCIRFASITQEKYKMLKSDISYDELVQKGGVLLCSKTYKLDDNSEKWVEDSDALKTVPDKITIRLISGKKESGDPETEDFSFDVSGTYTLKPNVNEYGSDSDIIAVVPMENYYKLFERLEFTDDESIMTKYTNLNITYPMKRLSVGLVAKDGKVNEAEEFIKDTFKERAFITSYVSQKQTLERSAKALRIAGMSLAAIVFAVAMMNIASTCAAEMVNRRRELSMLRAGGMSLRQIFKTVRIEVLLCSGVSTAISSLFGTLAASVIFKLIDEDAKPAALPFSAMAAVFVLMYAVMLCAYLLPLKNMSRTSIAQDIRMKE
ncbi:MAG: ABC transporter permease [Ruminococcus sp.]|nr:ABC transporter permease [Ruminococcus sp.]